MDNNLIKIIIGYLIIINIVSIAVMWLKVKTKVIKMNGKGLNILFVILAAAGGVIGVLVGNEMINYDPESKLFKRWIPILVFIEVCIIGYIIYNNMI